MSKVSSTLAEAATFFSAFVRNPGSVGAVFPASRYLARSMLEGIEFDSSDVLIELGPGTGSITEHMPRCFKQMPQYIGIEREQRFVEHLRRRLPEMHFIHGLAQNALQIHQTHHKGYPKAIISSLPFASLSRQLQTEIIENLDALMGEGTVFRTYQYLNAYFLPSGFRFRRRMSETFGEPEMQRIQLFNLPPAVVFTWRRN